MKSCIVIPPAPFLEDERVFPPLGPYYIKRYVEDNSTHTVDILYDSNDTSCDCISKPQDNVITNRNGKIIGYKSTGYDVIGYSITTAQYPHLRTYSSLRNPVIVIGGPHCTYNDVKDIRFNHIIRGDGCKPFLNVLNGKLPGHEPDDPDQLPYRDKSMLNFKYQINGLPATVMMTSRGCPNNCRFCEHARTPVRLKSIAAVEQELFEITNLGFKGVMFFDDLFTLNDNRVFDLCDIIRPFSIKFRAFAHARNFTNDMASRMADAGCVEIGYGAEHASQKILDAINKKTHASENYDLIQTAHKYKIRVKAFLMIGLPGEDHETVKELEQFILTSGVDNFDLCIYYPYAGSHIAQNPEKYDIEIWPEEKESYYKGHNSSSVCRVSTSALTREEIVKYRDQLYSYHKRFKT